MIKKPAFSVLCTLFIVPMVNGMDLKNKIEQKQNHEKIKIEKFEDQQKLIDYRNQYRSKHHGFAEDHNQGASTSSHKNGDGTEKK
jgi:hypothetical protein